mmetsp:Transcript_100097/g.250916  ORF Transcript_100097/g.250916 Transcript_100097/m.250916 type:complete len:526 (+) Transcript_100097:131-1708(+)
MTELDMVCNDAESQLQAGAAVVTAAAPQVDGGQGGELHALLGQGGQQRPAWLRRVSLAAGAAALLLVGVGTRHLGRGGTGGGQGLTLSGGAATGVTQFHESKEECSLHGGAYNCIETECCKGPHMVCFEKNEHYATCRESCVVGEHHDDPEEHRTPWSCKPLNKDSDTDSAPRGSTITLKSHHGKYVVADRFHGRWVKADRDEADLWEAFKVVEQGDHTVALLSHHQDYVACEPDGDLRADRTAANTWEKFIWVDNSDGTVSLLCGHTGKYVKATPDGVLRAEAHLIDDWEKFRFEEVDDTVSGTEHCSTHGPGHNCLDTQCCKDPHRVCFEKNKDYATCLDSCVEGGEEHQKPWSCKPMSPEDEDVSAPPVGSKIALKTAHERYVTAHPNGLMEADRKKVGPFAVFKVHKGDDHKIALESSHGKFVACEPHNVLKADREVKNTWEMFGWVYNSDGTVSLLCHTGRFWNAPPGGELKAEGSFVGSWEQFQVEVVDEASEKSEDKADEASEKSEDAADKASKKNED